MLPNIETVKEAVGAALEFAAAAKSFKTINIVKFYKAARKLAGEAKRADEIKAAYKALTPSERDFLRDYIRFGLKDKTPYEDEKIGAILDILGAIKTLLS